MNIFLYFCRKINPENLMIQFKLQVFHACAENLSFTKASEKLFITQPAVTKNIKELETRMGIKLFERSKSGISLTQAGIVLLKYTEKVLEIKKKSDYEISLLRESFAGNLKLGASTTIGQYILPAVLARFNRQFPDIELSLLNKNTQEIEQDVIHKEIDLGIIEGSSKRKELKYSPFMKDEIVAVVHKSNELCKKDCLTPEELKHIPLVLREIGSGSLEVIADSLFAHGIKLKNLNIKMHLGSTESIKNYLANSDCMSFVSVHAVNREIINGEFKIIAIENLRITRRFHFIYLQGTPDGFVQKFMAFVNNTQ